MQTNDDVLHEDINDDTINLDILYEKEPPKKENELEKLNVVGKVPLDFHFVQTEEQHRVKGKQDDDPSKIESMAINDVPLSTSLSRFNWTDASAGLILEPRSLRYYLRVTNQ